MKILIVSSHYSPEIGAAPARITNMAKGLHNMGYEVDVLTCLPNYPQNRIYEGYRHRLSKKEVLDDITVFHYWTCTSISDRPIKRALSMFAFAFTLWCFAFHVRRIKSYDKVIIQTPTIVSAASAMMLFKLFYRKNVVLNVSDLWPLTGVAMGVMRKTQMSYKYMAWLERFLYSRSDSVIGQSSEIVSHVKEMFPDKSTFLYRNLQPSSDNVQQKPRHRHSPLRIVYAGLLGYAQNVSALIQSVDFRKLGAEMHLYGGGGQVENIKSYIDGGAENVYYHGVVSKTEVNGLLNEYDVSVVPLAAAIYGAVPSKIYELLPAGIPVLFSGEGEGAGIVNRLDVGFNSAPGDYESLSENISKIISMSDDEYSSLVEHCYQAASSEFSFSAQMNRLDAFLRS